ncbi:hypothetical protein F5B18DRAFT_620184 [Nemania serpens]|nr:hypothetical protein F5B18DRAFT_620184 [Nemania serpens]
MSYYLHPDVRTLKEIADSWRRDPGLSSRQSSRANTPHDAQALARLVSTSCWAVQDPYSTRVEAFCNYYRRAQTLDYQNMSDSQLLHELSQFLAEIDELFFFSLLSRRIEKEDGVSEFVQLKIMKTSEHLRGFFEFARGREATIKIWRRDSHGRAIAFEPLLYTLVHESVHAYLDIFSDIRHPKYEEWVTNYNGHGEMFWVLLRFISERIRVFTKSERWRKEMERGELDCVQITKIRGQAGFWGTPERTLMGGVLGP